MNYLYIDTEFSNFDPRKGDMLQLSLVPIVDGEKKAPFNEFIKPINKGGWNHEAEKVHKISWSRAELFPTQKIVAERLKLFLDHYNTHFTVRGYNCRGDKKYLEKFIRDNGLIHDWCRCARPKWLDVYAKAKNKLRSVSMPDLKLKTVAKHFNIPINAHDALSDAVATYLVDEALGMIPSRIYNPDDKMPQNLKRQKYMDSKYVIMNPDGDVFINNLCTENPEALKVVLQELWDLYVDETSVGDQSFLV